MRNTPLLALTLLALALAAPLHAEEKSVTKEKQAAARRFFDSGNHLFAQGRFTDAAREYSHAFDEVPLAEFAYNAATAHDKAGERKEAVAMFRRYLALPRRDSRDDPVVRSRLEILERELAPAPSSAPPPTAAPAPPAAAPPPTVAPPRASSFPYLEPTTRHPFPTILNHLGKEYVLLGAGVRTVFGFKVYAMALYVDEEAARRAFPKLVAQAGGADLATLTRGDFAHQFVVRGEFGKHALLHFLRDVDAGKQRDSYRDSLATSFADAAPPQTRKDAQGFLDLFDRDVKSGEDLVIHTDPDGRIWVKIADQPIKGGPTSVRLEYDIWDIWLGSKPISSDLKKRLLDRLEVLGR